MPSSPSCTATPWKRSGRREAKRRAMSTCSTDSTLTEKKRCPLNTSRLDAVAARLHRISGGSSDSELKLLAVRPTKRPSGPRVAMMVTPVAKRLRHWRICAGSLGAKARWVGCTAPGPNASVHGAWPCAVAIRAKWSNFSHWRNGPGAAEGSATGWTRHSQLYMKYSCTTVNRKPSRTMQRIEASLTRVCTHRRLGLRLPSRFMEFSAVMLTERIEAKWIDAFAGSSRSAGGAGRGLRDPLRDPVARA